MKNSTARAGLVCALAIAILPGCNSGFQADGVVVISAATPSWAAESPFDASATIGLADGSALPADYVVTAALEWAAPSGQPSPRQILSVVPAGDGGYTVHAPAEAGRAAQVVTLRWLVEGTSNNVLAEQAETFQVGCPPGNPGAFLAAMQSTVLSTFGSLSTVADIGAAGYVPNNHGWPMIDGIGTTFVHPNPTLAVGTPSLLIFTAPPGADITDDMADEPYTLVGWAYGRFQFDPAAERPTLGCVPYHEWFVHEAGWHTPGDGGMVLDPPPHLGALGIPQAAIDAGATPAHYHSRLWDLHFWADPSGVPRVTILNTAPDGSLIPSGTFPPPPGMFFYPPIG